MNLSSSFTKDFIHYQHVESFHQDTIKLARESEIKRNLSSSIQTNVFLVFSDLMQWILEDGIGFMTMNFIQM